MTAETVAIRVERPDQADVLALLDEHLTDMFATSPAESVHALDHTALGGPAVTFITARDAHDRLLGCGALSMIGTGDAEIKSMRTTPTARGRGVAAAVLEALVAEARARGVERLWLETGSQDFFAPARRLYARHGFAECGPFASYVEDPNSVFMTRSLTS